MAGNTTTGGMNLFIAVIIFSVICSIFLLLRLLAARLVRRPFLLDDAFVIFAFANTLALSGVLFWLIFNGMGKHIEETSAAELAVIFQGVTAAYICWTLGTGAVKLSIIFMYTRIFATPQFRRWAYTLIGAVAAFTIAFFVVFLTNCQPISQMWAPVHDGFCRPQEPSEFASISCSLAIDLSIIILPFPWLWRLKMPLRNKITVSVTLSIGFATIAVMIWRYPVTVESAKDKDFTYHLIDIALITMLELWLGIIVACIPTLGPIISHYGQPALASIINTFRNSSHGPGSKDKQTSGASRDFKMATLPQQSASHPQFMNHVADRGWSQLNDSNEVINADSISDCRSQQPYSMVAEVSATAIKAEKKNLSNQAVNHCYYNGKPSYLGNGQSGTTTDIAIKPRQHSTTTNDNALPQGVIYVQRNFSSTNEVARSQV